MLSRARRAGTGPDAREVYDELYRVYWYPVYAFMRHKCDPERASDLTQQLFLAMFQRGDLQRVAKERGSFRSWLCKSALHVIANDTRHQRAQRRDVRLEESFDVVAAEQRYASDVSQAVGPEQLFHRNFAICLINDSVEKLEAEYLARGKHALFVQLIERLRSDTRDAPSYETIAAALGSNANALAQAADRMRMRLRHHIAEHVGQIVSLGAIDDEVQALFAALDLHGPA